ncbi:gamma-glutamylcyclotransferase [Pleomorphomonas sp. NRK KF1]|uniref:gamma-glutamylcyclotransferase n=1 Tax=Pleomorphomonas sp. NRK KF1 TaxID=2943000 RepID=UPI0020449E12|nr:gamma-glutamylcyclotransferase [Pleomorphomonas sp. NRK KF1]MCM5554429.1 gamma-glutamylcyclotransferase [Pleomorphomonas sp. NRK KF1]
MDASIWVFGYGSLMWNPGFPHLRAVQARMHGVRRALCIRSTHYRGTPENPGLVFGLDRGGSCHGVAFEVAEANREAVIAYLRAREQISMVYHEVVRPARLLTGETVGALVYVANQAHEQYAGGLAFEQILDIIRRSSGEMGPNVDYVTATLRRLQDMGIRDRALEQVVAALMAPRSVPPG